MVNRIGKTSWRAHKIILHACLAALIFIGLAVTGSLASPLSQTTGVRSTDTFEVASRASESGAGSSRKLAVPQSNFTTAAQSAHIQVNYSGTWSTAATQAFEYAVSIWEAQITSTVTIEIDAAWVNYPDTNLISAAVPRAAYRDFANAPYANTWYPVALANKLYGSDLDGANSDIAVYFNQAFADWYFGTDGNPGAAEWDFVSAALREIGHGLGIIGSMRMDGGDGYWGSDGYPCIYDRFVVNGAGQSLLDTHLFPNHSAALGAQLTGDDLFFNGVHAAAASPDGAVKLHAPTTWQFLSSFSSLDETKYTVVDYGGDAMLTPFLDRGEVVHVPGPIVLGILADLGWTSDSGESTSTPTAPITATRTAARTATWTATATATQTATGTRISGPPTGTASRTPGAWNYLPNLNREFAGPATPVPMYNNAITGQVRQNGAAAAGVAVELRYCIATMCSSAGTTLSGSQGSYAFRSIVPLTVDQAEYYVRYLNGTNVSGRLAYYASRSLSSFTAASVVDLGSFDIADIVLVSPEASAAVAAQSTFRWTKRPATPSDNYEFDLYDADWSPSWYSDRLGYVDSYELNGLPEGFYLDVPYYWEVWAYDPQGGHGISFARGVSFTSGITHASIPQPVLTLAQQIQHLEQIERLKR